MSYSDKKMQSDFLRAIAAQSTKKTKAYDTTATVTKVDEDGTAWVHIPGGVDETPCEMTISCSEGDSVKVRVSGGRCYTIGNVTSPPTDDSTVTKETEKITKKIESVSNITVKGEDGEDAVLLCIDSSRGVIFKNDAIETVLTVTIYKGSEQITDIDALHETFGTGAYLQWYWQKLDEETYGVISADDSKLSNSGFTMTITPDDIDTKATFKCELML